MVRVSFPCGVAAAIVFASPAAASICFGDANPQDTTPVVCGDLDVRTTDGTTSYTSGVPEKDGYNVSVSGAAGGSGKGASASVSASYGALHLYGKAFYGADSYQDTAIGRSYGSFQDMLTVGPTDATVVFTSSLDGSFNEAQGLSVFSLYDLQMGQFIIDKAGSVGPTKSAEVDTFTESLTANDSYLIYEAVEADADVVSPDYDHAAASATADIRNTGKLNIDVLTGSVTYASGHDYSTGADVGPPVGTTPAPAGAAPEPSTWALMMAGVGTVGVLGRRRRDRSGALA